MKTKTHDETVYLDAAQVCARYGNRSHMWLERKLHSDPEFPKPIYIDRLRFFKITDLEKFERVCAERPPVEFPQLARATEARRKSAGARK